MEYKEEFSELTELNEELSELNNEETVDETEVDAVETDSVNEEQVVKAKKKFPLQVPVIIAACIFIGAIIAYFAVSIFTPTVEGSWVYESEDGYSFYYTMEENSDGQKCVMNIGTIYFPGTYETSITEDQQVVSVSTYAGYINGSYAYDITGNRLIGNRVLTLTSEDGSTFTLTQVKKPKDSDFVAPADDFKPVESILGEWEFVYEEYDVSYKLTVNDDGTLVYDQFGLQEIHCAYAADDETISLSFYETEVITQEEKYYFEGDELVFLGIKWTRVGESTADQA